jgi:DNA-binding IclR family transcriptional regulator
MAQKLPSLPRRGQQIMSLVLNAVAFGTHSDTGNVDTLAEQLGTTPGRLRSILRKLVNQGYVTIKGKIAENVYPTVAALRWQDPKLSEREAKAILRRLK